MFLLYGLLAEVQSPQGFKHLLPSSIFQILQVVETGQCLRKVDQVKLNWKTAADKRSDKTGRQRDGLRGKLGDMRHQASFEVRCSGGLMLFVSRHGSWTGAFGCGRG